MRSPPPPPALQNVLVNRPGATGVVARRDHLLTAAVFAAEDAHDARSSRSRSVFARMQRKMSRLSDSLRRRSRGERRKATQLVPTQHVAFDRNGHASPASSRSPPPPPPPQSSSPSCNVSDALASQVLLHRERILRMERENRERRLAALRFDDIDDDGDFDELGVSSMREPTSRRVRQVGAREDDDTLLMLPRIASVSFSGAGESAPSDTAKVRQLPRVSGLMPTRASPRHPSSPIASASPVSSTARSASTSSTGRRTIERQHVFDRPASGASASRNAKYRLPTALFDRDVEKEMETAIVEVASDGESDSSSDPQLRRASERRIPGFNFEVSSSRAMSDVHHEMRMPRPQAFIRRANSSLQTPNTDSEDEESAHSNGADDADEYEAQSSVAQTEKKTSIARSCEMFEDDYLSFQGGFRCSSSERPHHHQSMSSLLRSKRISSVTDSPSDDSGEVASRQRGSSSRRGRSRNLLLGSRRRRRHHSLSVRRVAE